LGYFGVYFLRMLEIIQAHSHFPGIPSLSLPPENPHFISITDMNNTIQVFQTMRYNPGDGNATYGSMNIEPVSDFQSYTALQSL